MTAHASDRLSLTLPDWRSALKRRRSKKPKGPWYWIAICALAVIAANIFLDVVAMLVDPNPGSMIWLGVDCALWFYWWWVMKRES